MRLGRWCGPSVEAAERHFKIKINGVLLRTGQGTGAHSVACAPGQAGTNLGNLGSSDAALHARMHCTQRRAYRTMRSFRL